MSEHLKDASGTAVSAVGFIGSIGLAEVNTIVSIMCGLAGTVAACVTIYAFFKRKNKR